MPKERIFTSLVFFKFLDIQIHLYPNNSFRNFKYPGTDSAVLLANQGFEIKIKNRSWRSCDIKEKETSR